MQGEHFDGLSFWNNMQFFNPTILISAGKVMRGTPAIDHLGKLLVRIWGWESSSILSNLGVIELFFLCFVLFFAIRFLFL